MNRKNKPDPYNGLKEDREPRLKPHLTGAAMANAFRGAAAIELLLVACEGVFHVSWLPLAGGHLQQIGIVFIVAFASTELWDGWKALRAGLMSNELP